MAPRSDRRAGGPDQADDRQRLADRRRPVRAGVRGRVRGHAAPGSGHRARFALWSGTGRPSSSTRFSPASSSISGSPEHPILQEETVASMASTGLKATARRAVEAVLRREAKPIRRLLLATGRDRAPRLPEIVQIESTNICNAKCVFCPRDEMHRRQGVMSFDLFRKIVDECAALGITHVRVHNYGEPFLDRHLVDKVRYAKQKGIREVGMISNGSLITERVARGMIEAGLDAINISVDASGKEVFESTRIGLNYDKVIANIERLVRIRDRARQAPTQADPVVRPPEQLRGRAGVHRALAQRRRQDPHHGPAQLGGNAQHRVGRELPLLSSVADVHRAVGRPGLALLRGLRRPHDPRRPATPRPFRTSGTRSPIAPFGASTSRAAGPTSAGPATCRARTRPSGSRSSPESAGAARAARLMRRIMPLKAAQHEDSFALRIRWRLWRWA